MPVLSSLMISPAAKRSELVSFTLSDPVPESHPITIPDFLLIELISAVTDPWVIWPPVVVYIPFASMTFSFWFVVSWLFWLFKWAYEKECIILWIGKSNVYCHRAGAKFAGI